MRLMTKIARQFVAIAWSNQASFVIRALPQVSQEIEANICWMNPRPLQENARFFLRHTTREVKCVVKEISFILNINTLEQILGVKTVKMNEIARVKLVTTKPLLFDPYEQNRLTGSLIQEGPVFGTRAACNLAAQQRRTNQRRPTQESAQSHQARIVFRQAEFRCRPA